MSPLAPVPPHNQGAERAVLGSLLLEPALVAEVVGLVGPADFYLDAHGDIFRAMLSLFSRGTPLDTLTLADELERAGTLERVGGLEGLTSLGAAVPTAANLQYYARIVRDAAVKRRLIHAGGLLAQLGQDPEVDAGSAVDQAQRAVFEVADGSPAGGGPRSLGGDALTLVAELREALASGGGARLAGLPLGIAGVDQLTGGMSPGELTVLAGRPGMGKSSLAGWSALLCVQLGVPVGVISLEMGRSSWTERSMSSMTGVNSQHLKLRAVAERDIGALAECAESLDTMPLIVDAAPSQTIMQIRASARRMAAAHSIRLVVVDYLQLVNVESKGRSRTEQVTEISGALKSLAREMNIPVLALSQLNRESERRTERRPQLSDLRDSGSIEQDADVVIFVHRPGLYTKEQDPEFVEVVVAKNRSGPQGILNAHVDLPTGRWRGEDDVPPSVKRAFPGARPARAPR
ncbi:MAG: replicative DNA helicase [Candidatus Dormibacteraeota bacterium]|jgi:replicative DNA helicase|nr:replicative DNA helicase [Candidatus Dormibacteraeota bacterium]